MEVGTGAGIQDCYNRCYSSFSCIQKSVMLGFFFFFFCPVTVQIRQKFANHKLGGGALEAPNLSLFFLFLSLFFFFSFFCSFFPSHPLLQAIRCHRDVA